MRITKKEMKMVLNKADKILEQSNTKATKKQGKLKMKQTKMNKLDGKGPHGKGNRTCACQELTMMEKIAIRLGIGTPKENEVFVKVPAKEVNKMELKKDIKKQITWKQDDIERITTKYNLAVSSLETTDKSKKETVKYLKEEAKNLKLILGVYDKEMIVLQAILEEQ